MKSPLMPPVVVPLSVIVSLSAAVGHGCARSGVSPVELAMMLPYITSSPVTLIVVEFDVTVVPTKNEYLSPLPVAAGSVTAMPAARLSVTTRLA